ncbi:uncharacterized protein LOC133730447 [Rosa rugosa]|uniref:uncharacterized protein LOC133730447 n=1 Tax=Rosa rugosa TaxID=74645 RepID=UPI002B414673|nr:uncharacterized protein LOC133730447 [Rosa rugosa]
MRQQNRSNECNHRDKQIRSNEQDRGVIVNQMFFADQNSDTNSTTAIVMATKSGKTKMRRVLQDDDAESQNAGELAKRIPDEQDFTVVSHMDTDCETISIKRRQVQLQSCQYLLIHGASCLINFMVHHV